MLSLLSPCSAALPFHSDPLVRSEESTTHRPKLMGPKDTNMINFITKRIAGIASVACLAAVGLISTANAQLIELNTGNFTIHANGYSGSTLPPMTSAPGGLPSTGGGVEDAWGVFQVNSIDSLSPSLTNVFKENLGTEYWGMFYNSVDQSTTDLGGGNFAFTATGLRLDIYQVAVADAGDAAFDAVVNQGTAGRMGLNGFSGISDAGLLVLSSELAAGTTMTSFFTTPNHTAAFGSLTVTSNGLFDLMGGDLSNLSFSLAGLTSQVPADWTVKFGGTIDGSFTPIPEPSTYGAIAVGLLIGVVGLRRRMQANAVSAA